MNYFILICVVLSKIILDEGQDISLHSHMTWVFFLDVKSKALEKFKILKNKVEKKWGKSIKVFPIDKNDEFLTYFEA